MAEHERIYAAKAVSDATTTKKRFAFNFDGSLLDLKRKLNKKEDEMLNRQCSDAPTWSLQCNFRSVVSGDGFHFSANQRKRRADDAADMEEVKRKKYCIQTGENGIEDLVSSFIPRNEEAELQFHDTDKAFSNCTEPLEGNGRTTDEVESVRMMEKVLKNIRKFNICYTDRKPKAQMPFELSQLWSLMSCTKYSFSDESARVLDQKIVSCLEKSKVSHALWKMTKKDLQSVEQMAIDHVLGSKSNDLERRLVSKLRSVSRDIMGTAGESQTSGVKTQKVKPWLANHLSQLTWNGGAQRKFRCEHCTYQTDNRSHLLRHQSSIHNTCKPYHCYICTKEFSRVEYIKQHLITAHPGVEYDATRAKNELVFREQFQKQNPDPRKMDDVSGVVRWGQNHVKPNVNGGRQEFQSPRNDCSEMQNFNLFAADVRKLLCPYCDFAGRDSIEFLQHFESCRPNISAFRCHVCHETFLGRDYLQVHYANKHFSILYCCDQCPFYNTSLYTYDWHVARFHFPQSDQNPCPICCRSFGKQSELVHHIEMVHLKQPHCGQNASSGETSIWHSAREIELNDHHENIKLVRNVDQWHNGISSNTY